MHCQKLLQQIIGVTLVALLLSGCGTPAATPTPLVPTVTPIPPTLIPEPPGCTPASEVTKEIVWPQLYEVQPDQVALGGEIKVMASGGYLILDDGCRKGYNESHRTFQLDFDGEPVGSISCYVNHREATLTVPADALPGTHTISVEGGSSISIQVTSG